MLDLLLKLLAPPGISGDEAGAARQIKELLSPVGVCEITPLGSVICRMGGEGPLVMLTAHLDRVGLMAVCVNDRGFVMAAPCGGADRRSLAAARVLLHADEGDLPGVVCSVPPHLADIKPLGAGDGEIWIDTGLGERAKELIRPGVRISFDAPCVELANGAVCAPGLDNRAGCAAVVRAAQMLSGVGGVRVAAVLTSREETGAQGASTAAFALMPDFALVVDASMALTPKDKPERCGIAAAGPMLGISPGLDKTLGGLLERTAADRNIPLQKEVMPRKTGTDADAIISVREGIPTALVSIPLKYMHTPSETVVLKDIEQTAQLLAAAIGRIGNG
jgi:putative aminopeptidase FrvX